MVSVGRYDGYSKRDDGHDACVTTCMYIDYTLQLVLLLYQVSTYGGHFQGAAPPPGIAVLITDKQQGHAVRSYMIPTEYAAY